ncbi:hypothetical protein OROHE_005151 [Orobanche hederae]
MGDYDERRKLKNHNLESWKNEDKEEKRKDETFSLGRGLEHKLNARKKNEVWIKVKVIEGYSPLLWRRDICNNIMFKYFNSTHMGIFSYHYDHIKPVG